MKNILGCILFAVFCLGWLNMGQGPEYTWWNLIVLLGK